MKDHTTISEETLESYCNSLQNLLALEHAVVTDGFISMSSPFAKKHIETRSCLTASDMAF